jgi:hypothetical protein
MTSRSSELNATRPTKRRESQLSLHPITAASSYRLPNCKMAQSRFGKFKLPSNAIRSVRVRAKIRRSTRACEDGKNQEGVYFMEETSFLQGFVRCQSGTTL